MLDPDIYFGEVGTYGTDFDSQPGPCLSLHDGMCFRANTADAAVAKYQNGTGIGVSFYYVLGGPDSAYIPNGDDDYCWGWDQAHAFYVDITNHFQDWSPWAWIIAADIEGGSQNAWDPSDTLANRRVLNGFRDRVDGSSSAQPVNCSGTGTSLQFAVYSGPIAWDDAFGSTNGSIPLVPEWTYEHGNLSVFPHDFAYDSSHYADWFGGSSYDFAWQYSRVSSPDYDIAQEPVYMPNLGFSIGN